MNKNLDENYIVPFLEKKLDEFYWTEKFNLDLFLRDMLPQLLIFYDFDAILTDVKIDGILYNGA